MPTVSVYRLHTDSLDEATLQEIADHIVTCYPHLNVYVYPVEPEHNADCECGKCSGEDRALEQMEKGIREAENRFGDD